MLVGNHVIADGNDLRLPPEFQEGTNCPETWTKEREPVLKNHHVRISLAESDTDPDPIQRVHRVDRLLACHRQARVPLLFLRLPREKYFRILSLEGNDFYVMFLLQMGIQKGVIVGDTAAQRVRRAENKDVHCLRIKRMLQEVSGLKPPRVRGRDTACSCRGMSENNSMCIQTPVPGFPPARTTQIRSC